MKKWLNNKWIRGSLFVLANLVCWVVLIWVCRRWGLFLLKAPWTIHQWLWHGVVSGEMSLWGFFGGSLLVLMVWEFCAFVAAGIVRCFPGKMGDFLCVAGMVLIGGAFLASLIYSFSFFGHPGRIWLACIWWAWCMIGGGTQTVLMFAVACCFRR